MKNKKLLFALLALAVAVALMVGLYLLTRPATVEGAKTITVTVVHKDGTEKAFTYHTDGEYLGPVLVEAGLIEGMEDQYGLMVHTVDGETADWNADQGWWALWIGEEMATAGVSQTPVRDGDSFRWVYTIGY